MRRLAVFALLSTLFLCCNFNRNESNKPPVEEEINVVYLNYDSLVKANRERDSLIEYDKRERARWDSISVIRDSIFKAERAKYPHDAKTQIAMLKQYTTLIPETDSVRVALLIWLKNDHICKGDFWVHLATEEDFFTAWFWLREQPLNNETLALIETVARRTDACTSESLSSDLPDIYKKDKAFFLNWLYTHRDAEYYKSFERGSSIEFHFLWELVLEEKNAQFMDDLNTYVKDPAVREYFIKAFQKEVKDSDY